MLRKRIQKFLPELYIGLGLTFRNPFEEHCVGKKGLYVYVHSATDYFIQVEYASEKEIRKSPQR